MDETSADLKDRGRALQEQLVHKKVSAASSSGEARPGGQRSKELSMIDCVNQVHIEVHVTGDELDKDMVYSTCMAELFITMKMR